MKKLLYSTHPLARIMVDINVVEDWIVDYIEFHFGLSSISQTYDEVITIRSDRVGSVECFYRDKSIRFDSSVQHVTTKLTSWLLGIINDGLFKKNIYVFHGAACIYKNQTLLFLGNKGVGKSTLLYKLILAGGVFVSDDNIFLSFDNDNVYYSDLGIRLKNNSNVDNRFFDSFPIVLNGIKYVQPKNKFSSFAKPNMIYILSKEQNIQDEIVSFSDFAQMIIPNIKNSNSGLVSATNLIRAFRLAQIKKINAFEIDEVDSFFN